MQPCSRQLSAVPPGPVQLVTLPKELLEQASFLVTSFKLSDDQIAFFCMKMFI